MSTFTGPVIPLSRQVAILAERHEADGDELASYVAGLLRKFAVEIRAIETPGADPLDLDRALARVAANMPGWPLAWHPAVDLLTYGMAD